MKRVVIAAAVLAAVSGPVLAQSRASGTSAGGPARVGPPGQIGGGVPGTQPNVVEQRMIERKAATPAPRTARKAKKSRKAM
ncbi:hypothetical protein [Enterovirga aerilata]|uniref:Uncharacterized protein n=1 Tax=Enterovirga aerilata TaxID=2730920 RepID=A0A849I7E5_9HYPH|nr:hypothetical protein [Enterovirga sp. DB1703]NNM71947.1 hypothetical protein [Enterovirga sp. DB1703]